MGRRGAADGALPPVDFRCSFFFPLQLSHSSPPGELPPHAHLRISSRVPSTILPSCAPKAAPITPAIANEMAQGHFTVPERA